MLALGQTGFGAGRLNCRGGRFCVSKGGCGFNGITVTAYCAGICNDVCIRGANINVIEHNLAQCVDIGAFQICQLDAERGDLRVVFRIQAADREAQGDKFSACHLLGGNVEGIHGVNLFTAACSLEAVRPDKVVDLHLCGACAGLQRQIFKLEAHLDDMSVLRTIVQIKAVVVIVACLNPDVVICGACKTRCHCPCLCIDGGSLIA